jgi:hypothetical protein
LEDFLTLNGQTLFYARVGCQFEAGPKSKAVILQLGRDSCRSPSLCSIVSSLTRMVEFASGNSSLAPHVDAVNGEGMSR